MNELSEHFPQETVDLEKLNRSELIQYALELEQKYHKSVQEFDHLKAQLEINELVLDTQKRW